MFGFILFVYSCEFQQMCLLFCLLFFFLYSFVFLYMFNVSARRNPRHWNIFTWIVCIPSLTVVITWYAMSIIVQKRCDYMQFYYISADNSTCFGWYPHPSSGAHPNCNYNIWHWSNRICYRPLKWRKQNAVPTPPMSADGSKYGSTRARYCNYSLNVLLMMDGGYHPKHVELSAEI